MMMMMMMIIMILIIIMIILQSVLFPSIAIFWANWSPPNQWMRMLGVTMSGQFVYNYCNTSNSQVRCPGIHHIPEHLYMIMD